MIGLKFSHRISKPILEWTGPTSGSQNMQDNPILYFLPTGAYTVKVKRAMTLTWEICGNGAHGGPGGEDVSGGYGGGCGEVRNVTFALVPGQSYTLVLQGPNVAGNSYLANGATIHVAAGGTNNINAPVPSNIGNVVFPGHAGGTGGAFGQIPTTEGGSPGVYSGGYSPGSGGGGGSASSAFCEKGGDGGGNPGSGVGSPQPGGFVPCLGGAGGPGIGWRVFSIGRGGGGGSSGNSGGPFPGGGSVGGQTPGFPAGAVTTFVALA